MRSVPQLLDSYLEKRTMLAHATQGLGLRMLSRWQRFGENPLVTTVTFLLALALVVVLAFMSGCASLGIEAPKTFNEKLAVGYGITAGARSSVLTLLEAKKITVEDARNIETQINNLRAGLDIAKSTYASDSKAAATKLQSTLTILNALQSYLITRGSSP
jgi:hypothetical protein